MITKKIKKLLTDLNQNKQGGYVITRPLSDAVDYAKVWFPTPTSEEADISNNNHSPDTFYFIRGKSKRYVAAVLVTDSDLKWHLLQDCYKDHLFDTALKETILPHILQYKPVQRILLNRSVMGEKSFIFSRKIVLAAGFKLVRENEGVNMYAIEAASLEQKQYITGTNTGISESRVKEIRTELKSMIRMLEVIKTEIMMKTGSWEFTMDYEAIIKNLHSLVVNSGIQNFIQLIPAQS